MARNQSIIQDSSGNASVSNNLTAASFIKTGGTASQFLKADGSVDSNTYALNSSLGNYLPLTGGTISGKVTFPSALADRPQMPGGILGLNTGDGNFDIWGISTEYYPSHGTAANAWGIQWNGDNNQVRFIGNGTQRLVIDLDGGSTGALTWEGNNIWHAGNDGSSSGLDADLLDGYDGSNYIGKNGNTYFQLTNWLQSTGTHGFYAPSSGAGTHFYPATSTYGSFSIEGGKNGWQGIEFPTITTRPTLMFDVDGYGGIYYQQPGNAVWGLYYNKGANTLHVGSSSANTVWHSGNDGTGSTLDADLLDGQHGSYYAKSVYAGISTGDWQNFTNDVGEFRVDQVNDFTSPSHSNFPAGVYNFGSVLSWRTDNHSLQLYASHLGDLVFKTQWNNDNYSGWRTILHSSNFGSYAVPIRGVTNWNDGTVLNYVIGMLGWKNYGGNHVIFDASASTSPSGVSISNTNSQNAWTASYPTLMGWNGSQTYGVRVDSARISDTSVDSDKLDGYHLSQIWPYHTDSDFVNGTLVTTSIPANVTNGDSFIIEVTGKSYDGLNPPFSFIAQGYLYADTIISYSGINLSGYGPAYIKCFQHSDNNLAFWWPRISYWNSFSIHVRSANGNSINKVVAVSDVTEPSSSKKVEITLIKSWTSLNDGTGSGLDADTVDGIHASSFLTAEADTLSSVTGRGATTSTAVTFNGGITTVGLTNNSNGIIANSTSISPNNYSNKVVVGGIGDGGWGVTTGIGGNAGTNHNWSLGHNGVGFYMGISNGTTATLNNWLYVSPSRTVELSAYTTNGFLKTTNSNGTLVVDTNTYLTAESDTFGSVVSRGNTAASAIIVSKAAHTAGASDYHVELYSSDTTDATKEVSMRFHQANRYYWQIRANNVGFKFTNGADSSYTSIYAGNIYSSDNLVATQSWVTSQGYLTSVTNISGYSGTLIAEDNRTISPSELTATRLKFGFTSWNNDNASPYADFLHMRSYADGSGGNDNLVMFRKDVIGMRIYQQNFGSSTAYSSYKDIAFTDGTNASGTWGISITGNAANITAYTINQNLGTSNSPTFNRITTSGLYGPSTGGNIPIWQYDSSNTGYGIIYSEGSPDSLRIDVSGQALTGTPDFQISPDAAYINGQQVATQSWVTSQGYLTSYTETDTLASVTGRGATTSTALTLNGNVSVGTAAKLSFGSQTRQMIDLWSTSYGIGVQSSTTYFRSDSRFSWHRGGSHNDNENNPGGGTVAMTLDGSSNLAVTGTVTGSQIIRSGGTSSQFLKADGSVDSNSYYLASNPSGYTSNTGTIGGSTGSTDNAILRADGTGGSTLQASSIILDDSANLSLGVSSLSGTERLLNVIGSGTDIDLTLQSKGDSGYVIAKKQSTTTNNIINSLRVLATSSGTTSNNFGTSLGFFAQNSAGTIRPIGFVAARLTDNTNGAEKSDLIFYCNNAGPVSQDRMTIQSTGQLKVNAYTSSTSFSGTAAGYLAFDSSGNILTVASPTSGIGGSTGSVDNAILRADGTGGSTAQASGIILSDTADLTLGTSSTAGTSRTISVDGPGTDLSLNLNSKGTAGQVISNSAVRFHSVVDDTVKNAVSYPLMLTHASTSAGTYSNGIGTGMIFRTLTSSSTATEGSVIESVSTDITAASEDFDLVFKTVAAGATAAERVRITSTGILNLAQGQIQFPAGQNASANANTLDDYEEGTWTPTFASTASTFSYNYRVGTYTKIGNLVTIQWRIALNISGNTLSANSLTITGLPFTSANVSNQVYCGVVNWGSNGLAGTATSLVNLLQEISVSTTSIGLRKVTTATTVSAFMNANDLSATNGTILTGEMFYYV